MLIINRSTYASCFLFQALRDYKTELSDDPMVHSHLGTLYDNLLEQNLCRLLEPFSNVQIEHIARLINLPQVCHSMLFMARKYGFLL